MPLTLRLLPLTAGILLLCSMATAVTAARSDGLSGTWKVTRQCVAGCTGSTTFTETVRAAGTNIFQATGHSRFILYRVAPGTILAHSGTSSLLLHVRTTGQLMQGPGIEQSGVQFITTWRCTAQPAYAARARAGLHSNLRPIC